MLISLFGEKRRSLRARRAAIGLGLAVALTAASCASGPARVVQSAAPPGISVEGHGDARGAPDIARVTIGVEVRAQVAAEATEQANRQMSAVTAAISEQGVKPADMQTQSFSINFEQPPEPYPPSPSPPPGEASAPNEPRRGYYRVSNALLVTVRDLDKLGAVLGAATSAGANNIWGINFEIEDPSQLESEALEEAVAQATARAGHLARLAGVKLGQVVSISESAAGAGPMPQSFRLSMKTAQADVPVERGELTLTRDVHILFTIE